MSDVMKSLLKIFFLFCLTSPVFSQNSYLEIGYMLGGCSYLGDLAPDELWVSFGETNFYGSVNANYHFTDRFVVRGALSFGTIGASDSRSYSDIIRQERNLSFRSHIYELALITQFNLIPYRPLHLKRRFTPYIFMGFSIFRHNPKAEFQGQWYALQPLGTEGQGLPGYHRKYSLIQPAVPIGGGIKYAFSENLNISLEYGMRKTFTDYLDDVSRDYPDLDELEAVRGSLARQLSWRKGEVVPDANPPLEGEQRGDFGDLDWYIFFGVSVSYNFIKGNLYFPPKSSGIRKGKCPKVLKKSKGFFGGL
jgi:hypothetical protein